MTNMNNKTNIILPHGGYRKLKSYQMSEIIYDFTAAFCEAYMSYKTNRTYTRTYDQMVQAARINTSPDVKSGSRPKRRDKKTELKLVSVARASLEELLLDYEDYLRQHELALWGKQDQRAQEIRALAYKTNRSYMTYKTYLGSEESAANCAICLIHQANYLLDQLLKSLERDFLKIGGFTERLYHARKGV